MENFKDYAEMRGKIGDLFQDGKLGEASEILEWALDQYPDHLLANAYNLATCHAFLKDPEKAIQALNYGLGHGVWYGQWDFTADFWEPVKALDTFQDIQTRSDACRQEAQKTTKPTLEIRTPENYDPTREYPLFIALHGGGETIEDFKPQWTSPKLSNAFIVAYPQSSRVVSMKGFSWMGDEVDRKEILDAYQAVLKEYPVDQTRILIGGFSAGGHLALTLLLDEGEPIPVRGFVALCPPIPETYPPEAVARIAARGQRGALLTTEMDNRVEDQQKLAESFQDGGVSLQFEITPNIGHWYPSDFKEKLDGAVDFIFG